MAARGDLAIELGIVVEQAAVTLDDLRQAEELFLCNALIGIWPVRRVEQQAYAVGPVTGQLARHLERAAALEGGL